MTAQDRFASLPGSLRDASTLVRFGDVPALVAVPPGPGPHPVCLWMHGRTAYKELDPGRYTRWLRAEGGGIAACAIDLPGHGERYEEGRHEPEWSLKNIEQAASEIDGVVEGLTSEFAGRIDTDRMAIGGMSLGGMVALVRLSSPHPFRAAALEATTGCMRDLYFPRPGMPVPKGLGKHEKEDVLKLDPARRLDLAEAGELDGAGVFPPVPLLAVHSETDAMVTWETQRVFLEKLRAHYTRLGTDPSLIETLTWPKTGAPMEHLGFGRKTNEAKTRQTEFLATHLAAG